MTATRNAYERLKVMMNEERLVPKEAVEAMFTHNMVDQLLLDQYITPHGDMYKVFEYPTAKELKYGFCKGLGCAIALRAAKDFFVVQNSEEAMLRTLRSPWMNMLTEEMASRLATTLETNPNQVRVVVYEREV